MCMSCQACNVNGIPCHEAGCPDMHLHPWTGEMNPKECNWCGSEFTPGNNSQTVCDESCAEAYS